MSFLDSYASDDVINMRVSLSKKYARIRFVSVCGVRTCPGDDGNPFG